MFKKFLKAFIEFWNYHVEDHSTTLDILKEGNEQFTSYILHSAPVKLQCYCRFAFCSLA